MRTLFLLTACAAGALAQTPAPDYLNEGVSAFKSGNYSPAADPFRAAIAIDPIYDVARLYLAPAYVQLYIPGVETPENHRYAVAAMDEFSTIVRKDPGSLLATQALASLYYNLEDFPNTEEWNRKC